MATLTVSIPPEAEDYLRAVAAARGESEEEFIRQQLIEDAARFAELKADLQKGMDSLAAGKGIPGPEVFAWLRARAKEAKGS